MSEERVRFGFVSTANINDLVLAGMRQSDTVEVVAVGSRDQARGQAWADERGVPRAHGSYEALLADPDVEAVYISLPNSDHVPWALKAVEAGKHVLVEKPLTKRPAEAEQLFDAAEAAGVHVTEAFMYRHHPQMHTLARLVGGGAIGRLILIRATFLIGVDDLSNVRWNGGLDGGALMDVGTYCVSGARLLAGEPERVTAEVVTGGDDVDARLVGTLRFPGDVVASIGCALDGYADVDELEVVGTEGSFFLDDPWHGNEPVIEHRRADGVRRIDCETANAYQLEAEDLAAVIRGRRPATLLGRADAVAQARTLAALYASAEQGRAVAP